MNTFLWTSLTVFIYILFQVSIACTLVFIERRSPEKTLTWLMVITLIPVVGVIFYFLFGQDLSKRKMFKEKLYEDLDRLLDTQKAHFYEKSVITEKQSKHYQLMNIALNSNNAPLMSGNEITILNNGQEKFPALLKALKNAKNHIHMEYYIFRDSGIGMEILDVLKDKAKQGVQVRLLVDGIGNYIKKKTYKELDKNGVEYAIFFPTKFPSIVHSRLNYRNHRKIVVIDGEIGFFGGLNVGDEYLSKSEKYGFFRDTHYKLRGSAVYELQLRFAMDWEFASGKGIDVTRYYFPIAKKYNGLDMQILNTGPDSKYPTIKQALYEMITNARRKIQIVSPYFVPDASITGLLKNALLSGVEVEVMIPSVIDHPFVHWASTSHIADIIGLGAKAYIYEKGFVHSKIVMVDDEIVLTGTANFDIRSWIYNFEVSAIVYDEVFTKKLSDEFEKDKMESSLITKEKYDNRDIVWKTKEAFSRLVSPLL